MSKTVGDHVLDRLAASPIASMVWVRARLRARLTPQFEIPRSAWTALVMACACSGLPGCFSLGTTRLYEDQLGYSRALGDAEKSETLLNVVRMRYADPPTFLQTTQVISGYQLQRNITGGFDVFPAANPSTFLSGTASAQLNQNPTFTFQPISGDQFAKSFIRPLSPSNLLPLAMSGLPIDVLFRLGVQSVNDLSNAVALTRTGAEGSPDFFLLLRDLRRLQVAGVFSITLQASGTLQAEGGGGPAALPPDAGASASCPPAVSGAPDKPSGGIQGKSDPGRVVMSIAATPDLALSQTADEVRRLLGMPPGALQADVVYGRNPKAGQVVILTRSMLGVLSQVAIQIDVPAEDVVLHRTLPTVGNIGLEKKPVIIIHSGREAPDRAFTSVRYHETWFWIHDEDFDSKLAFSVLQTLMALARSENAPGAILTIPAR